MAKTFRPYDPDQPFLLPPSPRQWLPDGHLAYFVLDTVRTLDLSGIYAHYEGDLRGYPPYHPEMMVGLLLYGYCTGVVSSRKIEKRTYEDVAFRVIAGGQNPDHTRISEFRRIHLKPLAALFVQVLQLCQKAGMVKLGHVALDGTKMKANASKHKAMSYERMQSEIDRLKQKVDELLKQAAAADAEEDRAHGAGKRGDELPDELQRAETRLARIQALKAALEAEAKEQADAKKQAEAKNADGKKDDKPQGPPDLPSHRIPTDASGKPTGKAQRNFTDPESRIMKTGDGFVQGYNCQAAVDEERQIVVAQAVTNQCPDPEHLPAMLAQVETNCGENPTTATADNGYMSDANMAIAEERTDPYIAPGRWKRDEERPKFRGRPPKSLTPRQRMARKLATKRGAKIYSRRKVVVEPVFGEIKDARGIRHFLLRGLEKVRGEWALITMTHNMLKLHRYGPKAPVGRRSIAVRNSAAQAGRFVFATLGAWMDTLTARLRRGALWCFGASRAPIGQLRDSATAS